MLRGRRRRVRIRHAPGATTTVPPPSWQLRKCSHGATYWLTLFLALLASASLRAAEGPNLFAESVQPLLVAKCGRCHGKETQKAELALHTPQGVQKGGESGPVIAPGKPDESPLFEKIHAGEMPPDQENPLADAEIETIRRWIESGSLSVTWPPGKPRLVITTFCHFCFSALHLVPRPTEEGRRSRSAHRAGILKGGKSRPGDRAGQVRGKPFGEARRAEEMPPHPRLVEAMVKPMEPAELAKLVGWIDLGAR